MKRLPVLAAILAAISSYGFTVARSDTFQARNYRNSLGQHDYTWNGCDDATLFSAANWDTTNTGGLDTLMCGASTGSRGTARIWMRWNFGNKIPPGYALDSAKMYLCDSLGAGTDSTGLYVVKKNGILEGTGTGLGGTSGLCWKYYLMSGVTHTAWGLPGADSTDATPTIALTFNSRQRFRLLGSLVADSTHDRGKYPDAMNKYTAHGVGFDRFFDLTDIVEGWLNGWLPNNGLLFKDNTEATSRSIYLSSEYADSTRAPMLVLWGRQTNFPVHLGRQGAGGIQR